MRNLLNIYVRVYVRVCLLACVCNELIEEKREGNLSLWLRLYTNLGITHMKTDM